MMEKLRASVKGGRTFIRLAYATTGITNDVALVYQCSKTNERATAIVTACNSHDVLLAAIKRIANGEGYFGAQAREYKEIAKGALAATGLDRELLDIPEFLRAKP
jgi:hypothetical protein